MHSHKNNIFPSSNCHPTWIYATYSVFLPITKEELSLSHFKENPSIWILNPGSSWLLKDFCNYYLSLLDLPFPLSPGSFTVCQTHLSVPLFQNWLLEPMASSSDRWSSLCSLSTLQGGCLSLSPFSRLQFSPWPNAMRILSPLLYLYSSY